VAGYGDAAAARMAAKTAPAQPVIASTTAHDVLSNDGERC
jgi:hypothetical protein